VAVVQEEAQRKQQWHDRCQWLVIPAETLDPAVTQSVPVKVVQVQTEEAGAAVVQSEAQRKQQWHGRCQWVVVPAETGDPAVTRSVPVEVVQVETEKAAAAVVQSEAFAVGITIVRQHTLAAVVTQWQRQW
jgi:hypothetical protein